MQVINETCFPDSDWEENILVPFVLPQVDTLTFLIFGSVVCLISTLILRKHKSASKLIRQPIVQNEERLERKRVFLSKFDKEYGYQQSEKGSIDDWRRVEHPTLQPPLSEKASPQLDVNAEHEVYLDYAGSALPSKSQVEASFRSQSTRILANPHSSGPAASRTFLGIQQCKNRILNHFHGTAGRFASVQHANDTSIASDSHSGYEIVFTSGTTEALRIIAERFPWQSQGGQQSILLYAQNSHSSVLGMREVALSRGARFVCLPMDAIQSLTKESFESLSGGSGETVRNLLVFPGECNFGGHKPDCQRIIATSQSAGWNVMIDIAKAASTGQISLRDLNPDFACVSYYKLFGSPTGVGSLFVKRTSVDILSESHPQRHYIGGGSFNIALAKQDMSVASSGISSLVSGTPNFRGILELEHGFDELQRLGGMERIRQHTSTLVQELYDRLVNLRHRNGKSVVVMYGAWAQSEALNYESKGPTIPMNIIRDDGSMVGYNEVENLAALRKPAIQFRTGCFCNPGACQEALELTDEELIENYKVAGHVCGDHIDILNGKPTGAIRISFGKDSIWEDLDEFVTFIEQTFINKSMNVIGITQATAMQGEKSPSEVILSELYIFPIKSCAALRVSRWKMDLESGKLAHDREFALVDSAGVAMRLQNNPKMGFITPSLDPKTEILTVSAPGCSDLVIPLAEIDSNFLGSNDISVCGNKCGGRLWGGRKASEWFSSYLGVECWLARYSSTKSRNTNKHDSDGGRIGFANDQPILMISENAVNTLNSVLLEQSQPLVGSRHFRPNMVVRWNGEQDANLTHLEDEWSVLNLNESGLSFHVKGGCARCAMVDYDPFTGKKGKTLRALARYRRRNGQITFGVFLKAMLGKKTQSGEDVWIKEGDQLYCE